MRISASILLSFSLLGEALVSAAEQKLRATSVDEERFLKDVFHEKTFGFIASAGDYDFCFDFDSFCWNYFRPYLVEYAYGTQAYADAFASIATTCYASARAYSESFGFIVGEGSFTVKRNGNAGAVDGIYLDMGINSASFVHTQADTTASASTSISSRAYAWTDTDKICEYLGTTGYGTYWWYRYYYEYLCVESDAQTSTYTTASASSYSSGSAESVDIGSGSVENTVVVEGPNLQKFESFLSFDVQSFNAASSDSYGNAWVNTFLSSSSSSKAQVCELAVPSYRASYCGRYWYYYYDSFDTCMANGGYYRSCDQSFAFASARASAYATALGDAYAASFASLNLRMTAKALFERTKGNGNGNDGGDLIEFTGEGSANGYANAYCSARAYAY